MTRDVVRARLLAQALRDHAAQPRVLVGALSAASQPMPEPLSLLAGAAPSEQFEFSGPIGWPADLDEDEGEAARTETRLEDGEGSAD